MNLAKLCSAISWQHKDGQVTLSYVTGRYRWWVTELVEQGNLPRPHCICGIVGTEIFNQDKPKNRIGQANAS